MIARVWRGIAWPDKANDYVEHLRRAVFPELRQIEGFREALVLQRDVKGGIEFTVQTIWESLETVRAFAGETVDTAVVAPAAKPLFREFDSFVTHYDIVLQS
jgi:heme-degrading monooxygenase HmoA